MNEEVINIYKRFADICEIELGRGEEVRDFMRPRQVRMFETDEDLVRKEIERKLYEPQLPNAGDMERRIVERLKKISRKKDFADAWRASAVIKDWLAVLPEDPRNAGYYYTRAPMSQRSNKEDYDWFKARLKAAIAGQEWEKKWFYELLLAGKPEPVANFEIRCLFLLHCADGNTIRRVELRNIKGEVVGPVSIDPESYHAPQKFRKWCAARPGGFVWNGGEKDLGKLHNDISNLAAWRTVTQVTTMGWYPLGDKRLAEDGRVVCDGIWFFKDGARATMLHPDGTSSEEWLKLDEEGVYWHRTRDKKNGEPVEVGYVVSDTGWEGEISVPFYQKKPEFFPGERVVTLPLRLAPCPELNFAGQTDGSKNELDIDPEKNAEDELRIMRVFFREFCQRLGKASGDDEANLIIGSLLSFGCAPEIYAQYSEYPGIWLHGQASSGKSTIASLVMEIQGFSMHSGLMLKGNLVSAVGLTQAACMYSNLFVWADEFTVADVDEDKMSVLHAGCNRQTPAKFNASGFRREMRTNFLVSGEMTSATSAMRSRYPHVQIAATARRGTDEDQAANFHWLQTHRQYFHVFGRFVIEHRREFVRLTQTYLESWRQQRGDPRLMNLHGIAYASWMAMVALLGSHSANEVANFKERVLAHTRQATEDVQSDHNVNVFMEDLITAVKMGAIPLKCFKVIVLDYFKHPPGAPNQVGGWNSYCLLIDPEPTLAELNIWLTKQRQALPLRRKDLRDQMSKNAYWYRRHDEKGVEKQLVVRFGTGDDSSTSKAWGIIADKHILGYRLSPDADVEEFLLNASKGDPRKGPLFTLIEKVIEYEKQQKEGQQ
jgi:hypothetical protein